MKITPADQSLRRSFYIETESRPSMDVSLIQVMQISVAVPAHENRFVCRLFDHLLHVPTTRGIRKQARWMVIIIVRAK